MKTHHKERLLQKSGGSFGENEIHQLTHVTVPQPSFFKNKQQKV